MFSRSPSTPPQASIGMVPDFDAQKIAIIGAGWAGLQMMHCLQEKGFKVELFDKFDTVGGHLESIPELPHHDNSHATLA